jgi:hypothetical protein
MHVGLLLDDFKGPKTHLPTEPNNDVTTPTLLSVDFRAVIASGHPLGTLGRPALSADLTPHVQLILSDPGFSRWPWRWGDGQSPVAVCRFGRALGFFARLVGLVPNAAASDRGSSGFRTPSTA